MRYTMTVRLSLYFLNMLFIEIELEIFMTNRLAMLSNEEQIEHLQNKGISFNHLSIDEAIHYLSNNNYFFKLYSYRKNFPKHQNGELKGSYIDLDFAALKDMSILDMRIRHIILLMILDIEHSVKVQILQEIKKKEIDPYDIVEQNNIYPVMKVYVWILIDDDNLLVKATLIHLT